MKKTKYTTVEELLECEGFLKWYTQTDDNEVRVWNKWIAENPEHKCLADEAVNVILIIRSMQGSTPAEQEIKSATNRLLDTIRNRKDNCHLPDNKSEDRAFCYESHD